MASLSHAMTTDLHPAPASPLPAAGWLFYDAECRFCTATARRTERLIGPRGFAILPLQTPWVRERLGLRDGEPLREMIVLTRDGRRFGGADAALHLAGRIWWCVPLTWLAVIPGVRPLLRRLYAWIAARRSCAGGACTLHFPRN
jgi:predicted DCC family thiol-disulfide oxidoreductase YuxK